MSNISEKTLNIIKKCQQNEVDEYNIYSRIAKFVKKKDDSETLLKIAQEEKSHAEGTGHAVGCHRQGNIQVGARRRSA